MHEKAKQRIADKKNITDARPILKLPKTGNIFVNFKGAVARLCDDTLTSDDLTSEQKNKIVWLRSRIEIEM